MFSDPTSQNRSDRVSTRFTWKNNRGRRLLDVRQRLPTLSGINQFDYLLCIFVACENVPYKTKCFAFFAIHLFTKTVFNTHEKIMKIAERGVRRDVHGLVPSQSPNLYPQGTI